MLVPKNTDAPGGKRTRRDDTPIPDVDESVRQEARRVGLLAVLFAAGISAQALYALGLLIGLSPWTAWMLPGAMDLYAFESTRVASRVPARHPSRSWAVWNARLALSFTVAGNALFHALHLASGHHGWTNTDIALTAVSAIPPVIVERFLHLQTKINATTAATANPPAALDIAERQHKSANKSAERQQPDPLTIDNGNTRTANETANSVANGNDQTAKTNDNETANSGRSDPEWIAIAKSVYIAERTRLRKRPPEGPFHAALLAELDRLTAAGDIPAAKAPSLGTAKRVRGLVEAEFPELAPLIHPVAG